MATDVQIKKRSSKFKSCVHGLNFSARLKDQADLVGFLARRQSTIRTSPPLAKVLEQPKSLRISC